MTRQAIAKLVNKGRLATLEIAYAQAYEDAAGLTDAWPVQREVFTQWMADQIGDDPELLAKVTQQSRLDEAVSVEDREILLQALRSWGALDKNYAYKANLISADYRGYAKEPGGGLGAAPVAGEPINLSDILKSRLWRYLQNFALHQFQTTMFQPVGGMDMIGKAFAKQIGDLIQYDARVIRIQQNDGGVTVSYVNSKTPSTPQIATADWCVCTIPLSILSQIQIDVGPRMKAAIDAGKAVVQILDIRKEHFLRKLIMVSWLLPFLVQFRHSPTPKFLLRFYRLAHEGARHSK